MRMYWKTWELVEDDRCDQSIFIHDPQSRLMQFSGVSGFLRNQGSPARNGDPFSPKTGTGGPLNNVAFPQSRHPGGIRAGYPARRGAGAKDCQLFGSSMTTVRARSFPAPAEQALGLQLPQRRASHPGRDIVPGCQTPHARQAAAPAALVQLLAQTGGHLFGSG